MHTQVDIEAAQTKISTPAWDLKNIINSQDFQKLLDEKAKKEWRDYLNELDKKTVTLISKKGLKNEDIDEFVKYMQVSKQLLENIVQLNKAYNANPKIQEAKPQKVPDSSEPHFLQLMDNFSGHFVSGFDRLIQKSPQNALELLRSPVSPENTHDIKLLSNVVGSTTKVAVKFPNPELGAVKDLIHDTQAIVAEGNNKSLFREMLPHILKVTGCILMIVGGATTLAGGMGAPIFGIGVAMLGIGIALEAHDMAKEKKSDAKKVEKVELEIKQTTTEATKAIELVERPTKETKQKLTWEDLAPPPKKTSP